MEKIAPPFSLLSEEEIIHKIVAGETHLFEILIRRHNAPLYKVARCYGFNHQDAEDLMQETYITAYTQLYRFENRSLFKTWITKILIHKCLYKLKYGSYKHEHANSTFITENTEPMLSVNKKTETEKTVLRREFSNLLEHALDALPLPYKTVFILRAVEGFSVAETADLLVITPVNVKVRFNRAKALLQQQFEQYYSKTDVYEFNLVYCDKMVQTVFERLNLQL